MTNIHETLALFEEVAKDPVVTIDELSKGERPLVGCVPYFFPMELVHAAGAQPVELWGGGNLSGLASSYYPAFYCSVLFTLMERALDGSYDALDAVIIPTTCDGLRNLEENWKFARPDANVIDFVQPVVRDTLQSHEYLKGQLKHVASCLEEILGTNITERALRESIALYNEQRRKLREFDRVAAEHTGVITPRIRQSIFAAARLMPVEEHVAYVKKLIEQLNEQPCHEADGLRVVLTGILVDSQPLLAKLEESGISVVGDLTEAESLRYAQDLPGRIDPYDSLASLWETVRGSSVALDPKKERGTMLEQLVKERNADGVIACIVKFCEEEEFDVPILQRQLERADIPFLILEVESQNVESEQASTRIQAFVEMVEAREV